MSKKGGKFIYGLVTTLILAGAINWGLVGAFDFDLVSKIFGDGGVLTRIIFVLVGLSGLWSLSFLFRDGCMCGGKCASHNTREKSMDEHRDSHENHQSDMSV